MLATALATQADKLLASDERYGSDARVQILDTALQFIGGSEACKHERAVQQRMQIAILAATVLQALSVQLDGQLETYPRLHVRVREQHRAVHGEAPVVCCRVGGRDKCLSARETRFEHAQPLAGRAAQSGVALMGGARP